MLGRCTAENNRLREINRLSCKIREYEKISISLVCLLVPDLFVEKGVEKGAEGC